MLVISYIKKYERVCELHSVLIPECNLPHRRYHLNLNHKIELNGNYLLKLEFIINNKKTLLIQ